MNVPVKELSKFNSPAGAAFYGIVIHYLADGKYLLTVVDHVKKRLKNASHGHAVCIGAVHVRGNDFHADITAPELFVGKKRDIFFTFDTMAFERVGDLIDTEFLGTFTEKGFGA
jgi:hypothetical protein